MADTLPSVAQRRITTSISSLFRASGWPTIFTGSADRDCAANQIAAIVGDANKEFYNGLIPALGAVVSLLIHAVAGALSDRSRSRFGDAAVYDDRTLINILFLM